MKSNEELSMSDCVGNVVKAGDAVVYIRKTYCTACLARGTVSKVVNKFGKLRAEIGGGRSVESQNIYKL